MKKIISVKNSTCKMGGAPFEKIIILGDSLSDSTGRMYSKTSGLMPSSPQYYEGRFTNGYTWVDFLASPTCMNVAVVTKAEGGAVAGNYCKLNPIFMFISSMKKQISGLKFGRDDLAIACIGSNDYISYNKKDVNKVVNDQMKNINNMIKGGAKNIIVMGIPDFSHTPFAKAETQEKREELKELSSQHNELLSRKVSDINGKNGANVKFFDLNEVLTSTINIANSIGYNTSKPFHQGYIGGKGSLDTSPKYLFNDGVHPTQELHAIFAMKIHEFITNEFMFKKI
ncbi:SGNH/GDSL hydrolase family protein [Erwinia tasmaniensis]|uniref:SGNH/GDSL hydrolase family protein n=1 Tax=Erwinia tasmaniensis TaxID=338565 RepID=UPI003A4E5FD3